MTCRPNRIWIPLLVVAAAACSGSDSVSDAAVVDAPVSAIDAAPPPTIVVEARFGTAADTLGEGTGEFAQALAAATSLEVTVQGTPAGQNGTRAVDRVNEGSVDMAMDILSICTSGIDSSLDAVWDFYGESIPFGFQTEEYLAWLQSGRGLDLLHDMMVSKGYNANLVIVPVVVLASQAAGMFKGPVDDARLSGGFLFRTSGVGQLIMKTAYPNMKFIGAVGGSVANIVAGFKGTLTGPDCSEAGTDPCELQGAEFVGPCIDGNQIYGQGIADHGVTHYIMTQWQSPTTIMFLAYRTDNPKLAGLAARIDLAAKASVADSYQRQLTRQSDCLRSLHETRNQTIAVYPQAVLDKLRAATIQVLDSQAASDANVATVLGSMRDYAAANRAWWNQGTIARAFRFIGWGSGWDSVIPVP